jgi:hypothetical protein
MAVDKTSARLAVAIEVAVTSARPPRMFRGFRLQREVAEISGTDGYTLHVRDADGRIFLVRVNRYA